ncbi:MAG: hypothetical protein IKX88_13700, partial [Thermoguttaceae bacterium]|nr:hypothetical protein [Thermoguttaceae bacterium]
MSTIGKQLKQFSDYFKGSWGTVVFLSVLVLFAFLLFLPTILFNTILADNQLECTYSDVLHQEDLQVRCRENDAVILRSSFYVSDGKIYYLNRSKDGWGVRQTIDLEPYLKGWHTIHHGKGDRAGKRLTTRSFSYNDKWLCVLLQRKPAAHRKFFRWERQNKVLIFKRDGDQWRFHHVLASGNQFRDGFQVEVVHNQLLIISPYLKKGLKRGAIQCFDLSGTEPRLCQTIYPPINNADPSLKVALPICYVKDDLALVCWERLKTEEEKELSERHYCVLLNVTFENAVYRLEDNRWELWQNLSETIPRDVFERRYGLPLDDAIRVDLNNQEICICCGDSGISQFIAQGGKWTFADGVDYASHALASVPFTIEIGFQTPWSYDVVWRDKRQLMGVVKPSDDGKVRFAEPNWFLRDADPVTLQKTRDYYGSIDYYHGTYVEDLKQNGYESYYDFTDYIPLIDYSICGSTLVTSYTFDKCYTKGSPMQSADVWGGVNIYELDSETGPKRVFSLKTGHLDELKPVPVDETVLETNVPTLEEWQAREKSRLAKN